MRRLGPIVRLRRRWPVIRWRRFGAIAWLRCGRAGTDMRTRLGQAELPNPILTASGCAGAGRFASAGRSFGAGALPGRFTGGMDAG